MTATKVCEEWVEMLLFFAVVAAVCFFFFKLRLSFFFI